MKKPINLQSAAPGQQGVALAMALVILVILTILGISAMKSSSLELKMAAGIQDNTMTFQAAESGLVNVFRTVTPDPNQTISSTYTPANSNINVTTETEGVGCAPLGNTSNIPSGKTTQGYVWVNFNQKATATSPGGAKVTLHRGVRRTVSATAVALGC
jgi:Tfp pilus assembly protein PilX